VRIKLDENLPSHLVSALTDRGHDVDTVPDEDVAGRDDETVWAAAQTAGRFFITQDLDFSDARRYAPGTHHGLLLVRLPQPGRSALLERVTGLFQTENVESWVGCVVSATSRKVRVRRPRETSPEANPERAARADGTCFVPAPRPSSVLAGFRRFDLLVTH
jgi:hypothetical protein